MSAADPSVFEMLPLGDVRPSGWLRDQLRIQARGITGQLEELWPDVGPESGWLGGPGECWERGPYYLDGLIPLAHVLADEDLERKATKWIEWTLASQRPDGFFGPPQNLDWWPRMVMLNVLLSHHSATGDERVPVFVTHYLRYAHRTLPRQPLEMWAAARGAEMLPAVLWCHQRIAEDWLLELADLLVSQSFDWTAVYQDFPYPMPAAQAPLGRLLRAYLPPRTWVEEWARRLRPAKRTRPRSAEQIQKSNASKALRFYHQTHGVNHAMALRGVAYCAQVAGADPHVAALAADRTVMQHHGSAVGVVTADEHLAGRSPIHGIETCSVVETMRSCEELVRITGDGYWGDRLEEVGFNALPAALTPDVMGHQYYQQVTQVEVSKRPRPWFNYGPEGTLFGLEPTYGCCTANQHQGWPRLAAAAVMRSIADDGLAIVVPTPCTATASVRGVDVRLSVDSTYPFGDTVTVGVEVTRGGAAEFPLRLRVPAWAPGVAITIDAEPVDAEVIRGFAVLERTWRTGDEVIMRMEMPLRTTPAPVDGKDAEGDGPGRGVVVRRGPLVMSLALPEIWDARHPERPVPDWEVRTASPWAFALAPDTLTSAAVRSHPVSAIPFDHARPAVEAHIDVVPVPRWREHRGSAGPLPSAQVGSVMDRQRARLVPYGGTGVRVTVFPES